MSAWEQIIAARDYAFRAAVAFGGMAILVAVASLMVRVPDTSVVVLLSLLSSQAFTANFLLEKIAQLQAALDMKTLAQDPTHEA